MTAVVLPLPAQAYVYVIGAETGPKKVGSAVDIGKRLNGLQSGNPAPLKCYHAKGVRRDIVLLVERSAHKILSPKQVFGEWFDVDTEEAAAAINAAVSEVEAIRPNHSPRKGTLDFPNGSQVRGGRELLGWSAREFAERSGVNITTIQGLETGRTYMGSMQIKTLSKIKAALEAAGVVFLDDGYGVTKRRP